MARSRRQNRLGWLGRINAWLVAVPPLGLAITWYSGHLSDIKWLSILSWVTWADTRLSSWLAQRADNSE